MIENPIVVRFKKVLCKDPYDYSEYADLVERVGVLRSFAEHCLFEDLELGGIPQPENDDLIVKTDLGNQFTFCRLSEEEMKKFCMKNAKTRLVTQNYGLFIQLEIQNPITGEWKHVKTFNKDEAKEYLGIRN